jgi:hypothetical protein
VWLTLAVACWFGGTAWQRREIRHEVERVLSEKEAAKRELEIMQGQATAKHRRQFMDKDNG